MFPSFKKKLLSLAICTMLVSPLPVHAIFDFGGWVLNVPALGGVMRTFASPVFPPVGVNTFIYPPCINGVQEVNIKQALGIPQPPILLQFPVYTFMMGPALHPGQQILGKYLPIPMPCIAIFVFWVWVPCGLSVCPVPIEIPLPFFAAPLVLYNGSSI